MNRRNFLKAAATSFIWRKGGFACGREDRTRITNLDFAPTLLDLAGAPIPADAFDGVSFRPILDGRPATLHETIWNSTLQSVEPMHQRLVSVPIQAAVRPQLHRQFKRAGLSPLRGWPLYPRSCARYSPSIFAFTVRRSMSSRRAVSS